MLQVGYAISSVDGSPIFYEVAEPATGDETCVQSPEQAPPIILSDGIGCDGFVWKYIRPALARQSCVVHWHYRGHGRTPSPRDRTRVTIADHADDLVSVLDECATQRAVLMGHSMGVQVSLEAYRRHRHRVAAMVLMCGAPAHPLKTFHNNGQLESLLPTFRRLARRMPWLFNRLSRSLLPTDLSYAIATLIEANGELLDRRDLMPYLRGISRVDIELFLDMLEAANQHSAADILGVIDVPVLIVAGTEDGFTPPRLSVEMYETVPDAELVMVAKGSHTAPLERPEQVNEAVTEFLARRLARSAP